MKYLSNQYCHKCKGIIKIQHYKENNVKTRIKPHFYLKWKLI